MGVARNLYGEAGFLDRPVSSFALPAGPVGDIDQVSIGGNVNGNACLVVLAVSTITLPAGVVIGIRQIAMLRNFDGDTITFDGLISSITLPAKPVGRVRQITMDRHLDRDALLPDLLITAMARPFVRAERGQISILRYMNEVASTVDFPISPVALPATSIGFFSCVCIVRHDDADTCCIDLAIASITSPVTPIRLRGGMFRDRDGIVFGKCDVRDHEQCETKQREQGDNGICWP